MLWYQFEDLLSFVDFNVKSQRSSLSVVKGLLLQLLERNVGDLSLFKLLSALYERSERSGVAEGLEAEMWKALDTALSQSSGRILILIDGLDHLNGGESAVLELSERLRKIASKYTGVKCLLFSRPLSKPVPASFRSFVIQGAVNEADIRRFVKISFSTWKEFKMLKVEERDSIIEKVTVSSAGTFVWAQFALEMLRVEKTVAGIISSLDALPKGLPGLVQKLCLRLDMKHADTRLIVSMLLAAERPLSVKELGCLLEIDATNCTRSARLSNVEEDIRTACGSLVTIRDGLVCFAHASVKEYLFELIVSNKFSLSVEEAHTELTIRSLAYLKLCLKDQECEPSFTCGWDDKDGLVKKHRFFEYAVRNYIFHFKKSTMYKVGGKHTVTAEFKKCFAGSSVLALIEGSWWETQTSASTAVDLHLIALEIRRLVLGEKCRAVIQCQLNVALTQKRLSRFTAASETYFATMTLIRAVLTESHVAVKTCVKEVITCTESISVTKRSETITTRLEVVYKYMCEHSESSIEKITYAKTLAELYITLKKTEEALTIYREVRKLSVEVYGETHEETIKLTTKLTTILETTSKHEESTTITRTVLEVCEKTMEVWEEKRITATVRMVELYESRKEIKKAEELLLKLRSGIVELCKTRYEEKLLEAKIKITLQYVRFLKRQSRGKEAEKILVELWGEYKGLLTKKDSTYGDSLLVQIRIIGEEMKKWKNPSVAESIFSTLWGFYKRTSRQTSSEATSIAVLLASVLRSREEVSSEETILNEIFKASITRTTIDITVIKTFVELSAFYERQERWSEAIDVCTKSLVRVWGSIIRFIESAQTGVCSLPRHYHHEAIGLAYRLAVCYHREGKIYEAESLYIYMLAACRASLRVQDETILTVAEYLVSFYQSVGKTDKAIQVYHELFEECRGVLGVKHSISIKITYRLAGFCKLHQPRNAERYYIDIITALGRGSEECGIDSIEAVLVLCKIYEHDKKYREAGTLYKKLWTTFCRHGKDCGLSTETVLEIYKNYVKILEKEVQGSVTVYEVSVQFRGACITHYGKYHILTIQATIELARVLERDEAGHKQAISIYEEVCKIVLEHTQLRISMQTTILEVRKRLAQLYSFNASSTSKAEVIYLDSWEECRIRHGCTHNESLSRLFELVMFFKKQNRAECTATATMTLQTTIIEIVTKEKDTMRLFVSAGAIAKLYIALGHKELAFDLLKEIRLQLTSVEVKTSKKFGFSLREGRNIDRRATVFVVAFEETLKGSSSTTLYTDIMSDLMTETTLFESWMRTLKYGGGFEASLSIGARLRLFLLDKHRHDECNKITDELWELFLGEVGGEKANKSGIVWELFLVCVQEMGIEEHDITVLDVGAKAVVTHADKGDFSGSLELANWIYRYVKARGGFVEQRNMAVGFNLSLCMAGRNTKRTCHDEELKKKMMDLSAMILAEVLKASESEHMSFSRMDLEMVNPIVSILGEQGNFKDMEVCAPPPSQRCFYAFLTSPRVAHPPRPLERALPKQLGPGPDRLDRPPSMRSPLRARQQNRSPRALRRHLLQPPTCLGRRRRLHPRLLQPPLLAAHACGELHGSAKDPRGPSRAGAL